MKELRNVERKKKRKLSILLLLHDNLTIILRPSALWEPFNSIVITRMRLSPSFPVVATLLSILLLLH